MEFGVATGRSINTIASFTPNGTKVYGFDTFEGLPEDWAGHNAVLGTFKQTRLPKVLNNVVLIKGLFENTLPRFREQMPDNISFCHIDCDLYSSTKTILETVGDKLTTGSYVLFDEYFNYPAWRQHEWKAWQEFCESNKVNTGTLGLQPMEALCLLKCSSCWETCCEFKKSQPDTGSHDKGINKSDT